MAQVTVEKAKLRARIVEARKTAEAGHKKAVEKYAKDKKKHEADRKKSMEYLAIQLKGIASSEQSLERALDDVYRGDARIQVKLIPPWAHEPNDPGEFDPSQFDRDLEFLDMVVGDEMKVEPGKDRLARYL